MSGVLLDNILECEIKAMVKAGKYKSEKEVIKHALDVLLMANPKLRIDTAIELYRNNLVSVEKATEISSLSLETFKKELLERNIDISVANECEEIEQSTEIVESVKRSQRLHQEIKVQMQREDPELDYKLLHNEVVELMDRLSEKIAKGMPYESVEEAEAFMRGYDKDVLNR
jgi:predicted HTH domain antitoxin